MKPLLMMAVFTGGVDDDDDDDDDRIYQGYIYGYTGISVLQFRRYPRFSPNSNKKKGVCAQETCRRITGKKIMLKIQKKVYLK